MPPLRVGVVGVGHLGQHHARIYRELEGVELVGVCDRDARRAREIAGRLGVPALDDARLLIGRADAASIATPTDSHRAVAEMLLGAGLHVLVEKPLCPTAEDARAVCQAAERAGRLLQVGHIERFNPAIRAVRAQLTDPRFIACDRVSPFSFRSADIGVVLDLMIHDLDIVLHLCRGEVEHVEAMGIPILTPREDVAHARLRFASGARALLTASRVSAKKERRIRIFQSDRYISIDYGARKARIFKLRPGFELGNAPVDEVDASLPPDELTALVFSRYIELEEASMEGEPLRFELEGFVDAIRTGSRPEVSGEDGLAAILVADRIREAVEAYTAQEAARLG